jgi:hypothetical protein
MECPKCGYNLAPFENTCPRCARQADTAPAQPLAPLQQDVEILAVVERVAPRVAREQMPSYVPEVGWLLAICCCLAMLFYGGILVLTILAGAGLPVSTDAAAINLSAIFLAMYGFLAVMNLISLFGVLKSQRWGTYAFMVFGIGPFILQYIFGFSFPRWEIILLIYNACLFLIAMSRWHNFE